MILAALAAVVLLAVLIRRRHRRRNTLAGLDGTRPTFTVTPLPRSSVRRRDHLM